MCELAADQPQWGEITPGTENMRRMVYICVTAAAHQRYSSTRSGASLDEKARSNVYPCAENGKPIASLHTPRSCRELVSWWAGFRIQSPALMRPSTTCASQKNHHFTLLFGQIWIILNTFEWSAIFRPGSPAIISYHMRLWRANAAPDSIQCPHQVSSKNTPFRSR